MKEQTLDNINFIIGCIKSEPYLGFYFDTMLKRMHYKQSIDETVADFTATRRELKDLKNSPNFTDILVTLPIEIEPKKK